MLSVAAILDEFSEQCFSPDCVLVPLRSDDYLSRLRKNKIDLLLVESVWRGPGKTWNHLLVGNKKGSVPTGIKHIQKILAECRNRKIPTLFWCKEDPVHFNQFIAVAKLFDYIATTDSGCISAYKTICKHNRIFSLPFAAQPCIHKYHDFSFREFPVCFAGSCHDKQYPNRKVSMDLVLNPAIPFGLHIYDRRAAGGSGEPFPSVYSSCLRGGAPYTKMVSLYGKYKVFLNVNSIDNSNTMFSRRVFELLACGTPVISSYSPGIVSMLPEVLISRSKEETAGHLTRLLNDQEYWEKTSVAGYKRVMSAHTYAHRLSTIIKTMGIQLHV